MEQLRIEFPELEGIQQKKKQMLTDLQNFNEHLQVLEEKDKYYLKLLEDQKKTCDKLEITLEQKKEKMNSLQNELANQKISQDEVRQMKQQQATASERLDELQLQLAEANKKEYTLRSVEG